MIFKWKTNAPEWQPWFAWHPVLLEATLGETTWCWWEKLERKLYWNGLGGVDDGWQWAYRRPGTESWLDKYKEC